MIPKTMTKSAFPALDVFHGLLMLAALVVAYYIPFELVLLSYAILGPLHYLTEISWLHDRSYFMERGYLAWFLVLCTILVLAFSVHVPGATAAVFCAALAFAAAFALFKDTRVRAMALGFGLVVGVVVALVPAFHTPLIALLPTVIHVSVFTFLFMLVGALRGKSVSQGILVMMYVASIMAIMVYPPTVTVRAPEFAALGPKYFGNIAAVLGTIFGRAWPFDARLAGFLSFIYTYHYLNWFVKVRVIKWDAVSKERLLTTIILGIGATSFYFINYDLGFMILFSLSMLHVMLEFPLNALSIRQLGSFMAARGAIS